tara:strand:+ start:1780 stop:2961 length:1182 start_codon:yes stop_codon:yes gene_type:complete
MAFKPIYSILLHYSEIALKLKNRSYFEKIFISNINKHIQGLNYSKIELNAARVFIHKININDWHKFKSRIKNIMGLQHATLVIETKTNLDDIKNSTEILIKNKDFKSFRITTKRNDKNFSYDSNEINKEIGAHVQNISGSKVSLKYYSINIIIELLQNNTYIGFERIQGFSGLPARCQEKALSLISSGIDSPVASFEMIKRGVKLDFVHFHSYPAINKQSVENVKEILNILTKYQLQTTLYLVPLLSIQQKIMELIPDKYWVIFFRRAMIKIANIIAKKIDAVALVTGDSVGQVASQTLSNLRAVSESSQIPILRPLSGMNKDDIINRAKLVKTYDVSVLPYEDCCSFFVPKHPETKAKMEDIKVQADKLNLNDLLDDAINNIEKFKMSYKGE